ncbi:AMP-binding protein [Methylobacterium radiodurans]|uniref:AMP-binding protein n=1 Tax=Methylobacterium radiodurans TaxID=2202828 RepID=UPI001951B401|nr:AMP-binding protein [Methylobacterium radiodurans]
MLYIERLISKLRDAGPRVVLQHRDADLTGEAFLTTIFRYARALRNIAIGPETLVALLAPNHPDALAIRYAANLLGAAATFLSIPTSDAARTELLRQIAPDVLVVFPTTAASVSGSCEATVVAVGRTGDPALSRLDELAAVQADTPVPCQACPDDLAVVVSSGGSTGGPKGSWRSFAAYTAMVGVPSPTDRRQLVNGRLAYLSQVLVDITLLGGGCIVLQDTFDPATTLATIEQEHITDLFLVEPQLFELMDHPDLMRRDLSSLRSLTHIGASAPPTLRRRARERLGPVLAHTYGASEMGLVSLLPPGAYDPADLDALTCAGRVLPTVEIRFRTGDGSLVDPHEGGSIEVRSPAMAGGYLNRPDLEAAAFREGWYRSGDLGRLDAEGRLQILGRAVDVLAVGDLRLTPMMIEDVLCQEPSVRYAVVVTDHTAKTWLAASEGWPGSAVDVARCIEAVAAMYGPDVASRLRVHPIARVPCTEQGKPDREAIRRLEGLTPAEA